MASPLTYFLRWKAGLALESPSSRRHPSNKLFLQQQGSRVPWIPDNTTTECMLCNDSFTFFNRRHHCRHCGLLVCDLCSTGRAAVRINGRDEIQQRICDKCYGNLAQSGTRLRTKTNKKKHTDTDEEEKSREDEEEDEQDTSSDDDAREDAATGSADSAESSSNSKKRRGVRFGATEEIPDRPITDEDKEEEEEEAQRQAAATLTLTQIDTDSILTLLTPLTGWSEASVDVPLSSPLSSSLCSPLPASLSSSALFNRLSGFGSLLILDLRPTEQYAQSHIPRSISLPVSAQDVANNLTLTELETRVPMLERRQVKMRQRANIVLVVEETRKEEAEEQAAVEEAVQTLTFMTNLLNADHKHATLCILTPGYRHFHQQYPFLHCAQEAQGGRHAHLPPFPWYPSEVLPGFLYLGNHVDAQNLKHLQHLGITHVINVTSEVTMQYPDSITSHQYFIDDKPDTDLCSLFATVFPLLDVLRTQQRRVLIHCHQGISRSSAVLLAYLMYKKRWCLVSSYKYVKYRRTQVFPNVGFWRQLGMYEKQLMQQSKQQGLGALQRVDEAGVVITAAAASVDTADTCMSTLDECVDMSALQSEYEEMIGKQKQTAEAPGHKARTRDRETEKQDEDEFEDEDEQEDNNNEEADVIQAGSYAEDDEDASSAPDSVVRPGLSDDDSQNLSVQHPADLIRPPNELNDDDEDDDDDVIRLNQ